MLNKKLMNNIPHFLADSSGRVTERRSEKGSTKFRRKILPPTSLFYPEAGSNR
jgi:hypothetical protein